MTASNQYNANHKPRTLTLEGTLEQRVDLLRQVLQEHEQQLLPAQRYQQECDLDRQDEPSMRNWARTLDDKHRTVLYTRSLHNGQTVSIKYDARDGYWESLSWRSTKLGVDRVNTIAMNFEQAVTTAVRDMKPSDLWGHPADPELLREWASSPAAWARDKAARSPSCPQEVLDQLSADPNGLVRLAVAGSRRCPPDTLVRMLQDEEPEIARAAAAHPRCPKSARAMFQLARS